MLKQWRSCRPWRTYLSIFLRFVFCATLMVCGITAALPQETWGQSANTPAPAPSKISASDTPMRLLGETIAPGAKKRLFWTLGHTLEGSSLSAPVLVVNGTGAGPILCLTAAIHGDEINGIAVVHRIIDGLEPNQLNGAVIGVPIVNLYAYRHSSRYLPDRRDLNRYFPGKPNGSSAERIAHSFFQQIITHCNVLVDLHTGSFHRTNLPQVRANLHHPEVAELASGFAGMIRVHNEGMPGTLRRAATEAGILSLTLEAGEPQRLQLQAVEQSLRGIQALMQTLSMINGTAEDATPGRVFHQSYWVRAEQAGILLSEIQLGEMVKAGQALGTITDPITHRETAILSPYDGLVLGMALNQTMLPGYAAYHIGIEEAEPASPGKPIDNAPEHVASTADPRLAYENKLVDSDSVSQ